MNALPDFSRRMFRLGTVVCTIGAGNALIAANVAPWDLIERHVTGDWGDIDPRDRGANEWSIEHDARILSVYRIPGGATIWVLTEADRSATTLLLPNEY